MAIPGVTSYTVHFIPADEGGYTVEVPALPGCRSQGETLEEAERHIKEAIELYLETLLEDGLPLPDDKGTWVKHVTVSVDARRPA